MARWTLAGCMALAALGAAAVFGAGSATANGSSVSTISDAAGDAAFNAPAFQDLVGGRMTKRANGDLELLLEVAGPVPVAPPLPPPGVREIWWWWFFDLDPAAEPRGYPFPPLAQGPDFLVAVSWDGSAFAGTAIDRRPLFSGGEAVRTPVSFTIDGTKVGAVLPSALIRDFPASFDWDPRTLSWSSPVGGGGFNRVDGAGFATFEP